MLRHQEKFRVDLALDDGCHVHYYRNTLMQKPSLQFEIHPSSGVAIYLQIIQQVSAQGAS